MPELYGVVIIGDSGLTILDEKSMVQSWGNTIIDNIDDIRPVLLRFKFPNNVSELIEFRLSITYELFRTYSSTLAAGSLATTTSGSTHSHSISLNSGQCDRDMSYNYYTKTTGTSQGHTHSHGDYQSDGSCERNHKHFRNTGVTSSTEGTHTHIISDHTHALSFGMHHAGYSSLNVNIYTNGSLFMSNVDPSNSFNILVPANRFTIPGWNDIEIYAAQNRLSRVNATYFTQVYMQT